MGRVLKIFGLLVGVLLLLLVAAVIIVPLVVDPNDYKEQIVNQVQKHTGRELTIGGDLELSVFPWLGVGINELALSNAPGFGDEPFAEIGLASVRVKLMPLLQSQVEVDRITLQGLRLRAMLIRPDSSL